MTESEYGPEVAKLLGFDPNISEPLSQVPSENIDTNLKYKSIAQLSLKRGWEFLSDLDEQFNTAKNRSGRKKYGKMRQAKKELAYYLTRAKRIVFYEMTIYPITRVSLINNEQSKKVQKAEFSKVISVSNLSDSYILNLANSLPHRPNNGEFFRQLSNVLGIEVELDLEVDRKLNDPPTIFYPKQVNI
ncbi:MAG TPA: hypothetical protein VG965_01745 [Patescibacteria group bacterium]|nr:hypothetical protein [Patescibacteria group bacterium]